MLTKSWENWIQLDFFCAELSELFKVDDLYSIDKGICNGISIHRSVYFKASQRWDDLIGIANWGLIDCDKL